MLYVILSEDLVTGKIEKGNPLPKEQVIDTVKKLNDTYEGFVFHTFRPATQEEIDG